MPAHVDNDKFLSTLTTMYNETKTSGSVCCLIKQHTPRVTKRMREESVAEQEPLCLIRAYTNKRKVSTLVHAKDHARFQVSYSNIMKVHMDALKKKKKKKKK